MFFQRFYDTDLAQASYMIGCQNTGECLVIDPIRDTTQYLREASAQKLRITHVTETHIHADFLSGSRELADVTGAKLLLSDEGGPDWLYEFDHQGVKNGDTFMVGNVKVEVRHTPGHTPEHISFLVTDTPRGDTPVMFFTGDFVFVGDIGRPDLLDEAAGGVDTRFTGAKQMFASLRDQFCNVPDHVQVWPGHGAGSACGKSLGAVPSTTVGYERSLSWWGPLVQNGEEQAFVDELLNGQPDAPMYYGRMKTQNRGGPQLLGDVQPLPQLSTEQVKAQLTTGVLLIDTRTKELHQTKAPKYSVNIPVGNTFETWAGWLLRPETDNYILLASTQQAASLRRRLWMVGLDNVVGYIEEAEGLEQQDSPLIEANELPSKAGKLLLDIRNKNEYKAGHIPNSQQLHAGRLAWNLDQFSPNEEIVLHCQSGARSAAAASFLRAKGFQVTELAGGYAAWAKQQ